MPWDLARFLPDEGWERDHENEGEVMARRWRCTGTQGCGKSAAVRVATGQSARTRGISISAGEAHRIASASVGTREERSRGRPRRRPWPTISEGEIRAGTFTLQPAPASTSEPQPEINGISFETFARLFLERYSRNRGKTSCVAATDQHVPQRNAPRAVRINANP